MSDKIVKIYEYRTVRAYINDKNHFFMEDGAIPIHYGVEDGKAFVRYAVKIEKEDVA